MRRNDVVRYKENGCFYGRIIRIIDNKALWICCGLHFHLTPLENLQKEDYKGREEWSPSGDGKVQYFERDKDGNTVYLDEEWSVPSVKFTRPVRFIRMTTLRKLKQRATRYHGKNVWKTPIEYEYIKVYDAE